MPLCGNANEADQLNAQEVRSVLRLIRKQPHAPRLNGHEEGPPGENNTWVLIGTNHQGGPHTPCCTSDSTSAGND